VCAALSLVATVSSVANAQRALGAGADATVLPRGGVRVSAQASWATYNELYGPGGKLESLGAPYSGDSLGSRQLEILAPLRTSLRALAAQPSAEVTLGPARTDFAARVARTAFVIDLGLTSRIMLTARVPYEHTTSEVVFDVNPRNASGNLANVGLNPAVSTQGAAAARNGRVVDSLVRAAQELTTRLAGCAGASTDPVCSDRERVQALLADARTFAAGVARTYGNGADTARGALFVPLTGSTLQIAIASRVAALNSSFKTYIPALGVWEAPAPSAAPVSAVQVNNFLSEVLGIAPLGVVERSHLGDIEVGAKILLFDSFGGLARARSGERTTGIRFAVGGLARLGTGQLEKPTEIADIGTGDGQTDLEGNGALDVVFGRRLWASVVARVGIQLENEQPMRIPDVARNPFTPAYREGTVTRDLGDYVELEATPRYVYNEYISASAHWRYRRKGEDKYTGTFTVDGPAGTPVALDASILGLGSKQTEQRVGGGASFSTLRAFDRGRARLPLEVQLLHWQTISGSGYLPKEFSTQLQLRYYTRLFGAPTRPRPAAARRGE
jgi:hypothetical protein